MKREAFVQAMSRKEWRAMYDEWRKPYAHLPSEVRARAVRGCAGKVGYEMDEEAIAIASQLPPRPGKRCNTYPCVICKKFHIGNTTYPASHRIFLMPPPEEQA